LVFDFDLVLDLVLLVGVISNLGLNYWT